MKSFRKLTKKWSDFTDKTGISKLVIWLFVLVVIGTNLNNNLWKREHGVVIHDVISYYSYLPAAFIYHDLSFNFIDKDPAFFAGKMFNYKTSDDRHFQKMTMGLAMLYLPFFLMGHAYAWISGAPMDGFSQPYMFFLLFGALFYVTLAAFTLRKILLRLVSEKLTAWVLLAILFASNLFFYTTLEAAMPHAYNFSLIVFFISLTIDWHHKPGIKNTFILGLIYGLISLIRPTNALIIIFFLLYDINSLKDRVLLFLNSWKLILLMVLAAFLVVLPQLLFWKFNTGSWIYYSYGREGFFFDNPQIWRGLFSYRKGWLVYTPVMLFALSGLFFLRNQFKAFSVAIWVFVPLNFWIIFSWWDWTYGGSFGARPLIDTYSLMAIGLAAWLSFLAKQHKILFTTMQVLILVFAGLNLFQTAQYKYGAIHFAEMSKAAYWHSFGKLSRDLEFFELLEPMDYDSLIAGKYVVLPKVRHTIGPEAYTSFEKLNSYKTKFLAEDGRYVFSFPNTQTNLETREGNHAVLLQGENRFAGSIDFWAKANETYEVSVWKKPVDARAALVFAAPNPKTYYVQQEEVNQIDSMGWGEIRFRATVPDTAGQRQYRVYVWNKTPDTVFFDELRIRKISP
jgi:hypothetical protein